MIYWEQRNECGVCKKNAGREEVGKTGVEDATKKSTLLATDKKEWC